MSSKASTSNVNDVEEKKKVKRTDRTEKIKERKNKKNFVVKTKLRSILKGEKEFKDQFCDLINSKVYLLSKQISLMSLRLNHVLRVYYQDLNWQKDIPSYVLENVNFIRKLMTLGLKGSNRSKTDNLELIQNYINNPLKIQTPIEYAILAGEANLYAELVNSYLVNFTNHIEMNLENYIKRFSIYCQKYFNLEKQYKYYVYFKILGINTKLSLDNPEINNIILDHRSVLNIEEIKPKTLSKERKEIQLRNNLNVLKYFIYLSHYVETMIEKNKDLEFKFFNINPISKIKCIYITIDNRVFKSLLKELNIIDSNPQTLDDDIAKEYWKSIFNIPKEKYFDYNIQTDGISTSIHYLKEIPLIKEPKEFKYDEKKHRVIAIDPGRTNLYYGIEKKQDGSIKTYCLTRKQLFNDTGYYKRKKKYEKWNDENREFIHPFTEVTTKGFSIEKFNNYIQVYIQNFEQRWEECERKKYRNLRFTAYNMKQKTYHKHFSKFIDPEDKRELIIAYGASIPKHSNKNELTVPTKYIYEEISRRYKTFKVDEYMTTKISCISKTLTSKVKKEGSDFCVRGLSWCSTSGKFLNRDKNAALNIYECFVSKKRPDCFERPKTRNTEKKKQDIKIIGE
jgi:hypothetical protein